MVGWPRRTDLPVTTICARWLAVGDIPSIKGEPRPPSTGIRMLHIMHNVGTSLSTVRRRPRYLPKDLQNLAFIGGSLRCYDVDRQLGHLKRCHCSYLRPRSNWYVYGYLHRREKRHRYLAYDSPETSRPTSGSQYSLSGPADHKIGSTLVNVPQMAARLSFAITSLLAT